MIVYVYYISLYQRPCGSQLALSFELQLTGIVVGLQRQGLQGLQSHATHHVII